MLQNSRKILEYIANVFRKEKLADTICYDDDSMEFKVFDFCSLKFSIHKAYLPIDGDQLTAEVELDNGQIKKLYTVPISYMYLEPEKAEEIFELTIGKLVVYIPNKYMIAKGYKKWLTYSHGPKTLKIAEVFVSQLKKYMADVVDVDEIKIIEAYDCDERSYDRSLILKFFAYDYFEVFFSYSGWNAKIGSVENGFCHCSLHSASLPNSQSKWGHIDWKIFFKELKYELELRIPDDYLKEFYKRKNVK